MLIYNTVYDYNTLNTNYIGTSIFQDKNELLWTFDFVEIYY